MFSPLSVITEHKRIPKHLADVVGNKVGFDEHVFSQLVVRSPLTACNCRRRFLCTLSHLSVQDFDLNILGMLVQYENMKVKAVNNFIQSKLTILLSGTALSQIKQEMTRIVFLDTH